MIVKIVSPNSRKQFFSVCLGNLLEQYDTALYGFLSPFLAPLIFPAQDPLIALILTYMLIPLGMLARPVGALVFGYIGDLYGRSYALFLTLLGMACVSGGIALSPTYAQVGILAPVIFFLGRVLQNFFAAGEMMGGGVFALENVAEKKQDLWGSIYSASTMGGYLLASLGVFLISRYSIDSGWRFLYLYGCVATLCGCLLRRDSRKHSLQTIINKRPHLSDFKKILRTHKRALLFILICSGFTSATFSIALVLINGLIPLISHVTLSEIMEMNTYLLVLDFLMLPFFGWLASKISREKVMLIASLGVVLFAIPLFSALQGASLTVIIQVRIALVTLGVAFAAPFHAWVQQLIPSFHRYVVISLGYALGSQLLGGPTAALSLWLFKQTGALETVAYYWMLLAVASSIVLIMSFSKKYTMRVVDQL